MSRQVYESDDDEPETKTEEIVDDVPSENDEYEDDYEDSDDDDYSDESEDMSEDDYSDESEDEVLALANELGLNNRDLAKIMRIVNK